MSILARLRSGIGLRAMLGWKALAAPVAFGVVAIADDAQGRVLLVRHSYQPGLHLPGGGVNAGEPPADAVLRELREEVGLVQSAPPELVGLFTRKLGWVTNLIALYRVRDAEIDFKPNIEIREIVRADPTDPPGDTTRATRRRLDEHIGRATRAAYW